MANPTFDEFLTAARPVNPGVSDGELASYWLKTYANSKTELPKPEATAGGLIRSFGSSAIDTVGSAFQGGGEVAAAGLRAVTGNQDIRAANPLRPVTDAIRGGMSENDKLASQDTFKGDITSPSTIELPKTAGGWAHAIASGFGSLSSMILPGAMAATGARGMIMAGAATGALTTGGAAADDVRQGVQKAMEGQTPEQLAQSVPAYRQARMEGMDDGTARQKVENDAAILATTIAGAAGAVGGAFNAKVLEDVVAKRGLATLLGKVSGSRAGQIGIGAGVGTVAEGLQEGLEKVGQNVGENIGMGRPAMEDATRDTAGDVIMGGLIGGVTGGVAGAVTQRRPEEVQRKQAIQDIATAPNVDAAIDGLNRATKPAEPAVDFSADEAAAIQRHAKQRLAELERITLGSKGGQSIDFDGQMVKMPDQMGRFFTPEEKQEYDFLRKNSGDLKAIAQAYGFKPAGGLEYDRLGALGMINAAPAPSAPTDTSEAIPYDYSQRQQMYPALPAPEAASGRDALVNDTDPQLTRPEQMGDREAAINYQQAQREQAESDRDLGITPGTRKAIRARITLDEAGNIIDAPDGDRQFLSLVRREARPHAAAAIEAHAINPTLTEAVLAAPNMGPKAERTVFEAIINGNPADQQTRALLERYGVPGRLADANGQGAQPVNPAPPGQQPAGDQRQPAAGPGQTGTGPDAGNDNRDQGVAPATTPAPVPRPLTVKTDAELRLQAKNTRAPDELKAISDELARRKAQASTEVKQGGVGPVEPAQSTAVAPKGKHPNMVIRQVRDRNGRALGTVMEPYDGTIEGARKAAEAATKRMYDEFPDAGNVASRMGATDEAGNPKYAISPNFAYINPVDSLDGRATFGDADAIQQVFGPKVAKDVTPAQATPKSERRDIAAIRRDATLDKMTSENGVAMTRRQWVEQKIADGLKLNITQEDRIKPMSRMQYFRANNEEQRAHEKRIKEAGKKDVFWIGDYSVSKTEHDYAASLLNQQSDVTSKSKTRAKLDAQKRELSVDEIARQIQDSIAENAIANTRKAFEKDVAKGYKTREQADKLLAQVVKDWEGVKVNERTQELAQAIADKDPRRLVGAWAKEGQGTYGSEGSMRAFEKITGVKLLRLSSAERAKAIFDWAGWSEEQVAEDVAKRRADKEKRDAERDAKAEQEREARIISRAEDEKIKIRETGEIKSIRAYVDDLIAQGYNRVVAIKRGAATRYMLAKESGSGFVLPAGTTRDYAEIAVKKAAPAETPPPKTEEQPAENRGAQKPKAKDLKAAIQKAQEEGARVAKESRETITPAEDTAVGANSAGEPLFERKDGSRYRMRNGKPDFGGDLVPVDGGQANAEPTSDQPPPSPVAEPVAPAQEKGAAEPKAESVSRETPERTAKEIGRDIGKDRPFDQITDLRIAAREAIESELGAAALEELSPGSMFRDDELTEAIREGQYRATLDYASKMPAPVSEADIGMELAVRAYSGTSHSPEQRGRGAVREYVRTMVDAWRRGERAAGADPEALARVTEAMTELRDGYRSRYRAYLASHGNVMSSMIAGPAKFPVRSNQKRSDTADRRAGEANEFLQKGIARMLKAAKAPTDNSPQSELERARKTLADREALQERMKSANAALRKGDDAALEALGIKGAALAEFKKPDFAGRAGYPDYALKNNNAEIRRMRERVAELEKRNEAAEAGPVERTFAGVKIEEDAQDNRIRLLFDGKPEANVRDALKSAGFRWSPNAGAWQRQLTDNARRAAEEILGKFYGEGDNGNVALASRSGYTAPYRDLEKYRFTASKDDRGLPVYMSRNITLADGRVKDALGVPKGGRAIAFDIYDNRMRDADGEPMVVGQVLVHQDAAGKFVSFRNISIAEEYQNQGYYHGEGVVAGMLQHNGTTPMEVFNIQSANRGDKDDALPFWKKIGTTILNYSSTQDVDIEGNISLARYKQAGEKRGKDGQSSRDSREQPISRRDGARGEQPNAGGTGRAQSVSGRQSGTVRTVRAELTDAFGEAGVAALEREGVLQITTWDAAPKGLTNQLQSGDHGAYWPSRKTAYIFADNLAPGQAVEVLLHEIGEHYGLQEMLGDRYDRTVAQVKTLHKAGNKAIVAAWKHVERNYDLTPGSPVFMQEVIAKAGQSADVRKMAWWQRLIADIKAFLIKVGLKNVSSDRDLGILLRASVRKAMRDAGTVGNQASGVMAARAFHGTPHNVDRFSTDKIGTGEGAQAFGWGLYFAENEGVAKGYANTLGRGAYQDDPRYQRAVEELDRLGELLSEAGVSDIGTLRDMLAQGQETGVPAKLLADIERAEAEHKAAYEAAPKGSTYQVDIPDEVVARMLDWDRPLSEQPEGVREALERKADEFFAAQAEAAGMGIDAYESMLIDTRAKYPPQTSKGATGEEYYRALADYFGSQKKASEYLDAAGIPGIKYLDAGSRNRPLREIKKEFLAELPEDADFEEVRDLIGTGTFSPQNEAILQALDADDWLGFDYPAQALSAALSKDAGGFEMSPELRQAISAAQDGGTRNLVVFNDKNITITHKDGTPVTAKERAELVMASRLSDQLKGVNKDAGDGLFKGAVELDGERLFLEVGNRKYEMRSIQEASEKRFEARKAADRDGGRSAPELKITRADGSVVGYVGPGDLVYSEPGSRGNLLYNPGLDAAALTQEGATNDRALPAPDDAPMASRDQTRTPAFKAWFGDSKVVDENGQPLVVYHGTGKEGLDVFHGGWWSADRRVTREFGPVQYAAYLSIKNPAYDDDLLDLYREFRGEPNLTLEQIEGDEYVSLKDEAVEGGPFSRFVKSKGYDGIAVWDDSNGGPDAMAYVPFSPNQIKSATGNNGNFDPNDPSIMASRGTIGATWDMLQSAKTPAQARALAMNLFDNPNKFNLWDKTIGTQLTKARKNEYFRAVFDNLQGQQDSTAAYAIEAEAEAADVLARMEGLGEIKSALKSTFTGLKFEKGSILPQGERARDLQAVSKAIFSNIEGEQGVKQKVFTDAELAKDFGLNERQIGLYRQSRAAIDRSLDRYAQSLAVRVAQKFVSTGDLHRAGLDDTVTALTERLRLQRQTLEEQREPEQSVEDMEARLAELEELRDSAPREILRSLQMGPDGEMRQEYANLTDTAAAAALDREIRDLKKAIRSGDGFNPANRELDAKIQALDAALSKLPEIAEQANSLKDKGYAPAMRFGDYAVTATQDGETVFFTMVDTKTQANLLKMRLAREMPGAELRVNAVDRESFKLFGGVDPATVELFARFMEVEENDAFKAYIALATSSRSALKHMLERKGIAGFSDNLPRVMAAFITSNARAAARNIHGFDVNEAMEAVQKKARGDVSEEAAKLVNYMNNPTGDFAKVRGFMFAYFMGGSVSSALVNLTQPLMMTTPYLEQFAGKKIGGIMVRASKAAATGKVEGPMKAALERAEAEGITDAHEYHQLMQEAEGGGSVATRALMKSWGSMFGAAERFNRRITFLAAFETGQGMTKEELSKQGVGDAYEFAKQAVVETQGLYNRANRPNWARNPVGALAMQFKQFSIAWIEFFIRLPRKQQLMALGLLILMAGIEGLPFAEDLEDLIDTIGQRMGRGTNSKKALRTAATNLLGETGAQFALHGISGLAGMPMDVAGRLGMGNLIPGTKLLNPSVKEKAREVAEIAGPVSGLVQKAGGLADGNVKEAMPKAFADAAKAWEMIQTGEYRDTRGRKVMDVDGMDSLMKMIGFQPRDVAANTRFIGENMRDVDTVKRVEAEIVEQWADGIRNKDVAESQEARERLKRWNAENPDLPIKVKFSQILQRVRAANLSRDERFMKTAPPELRRRMLAEAVQ